jgi:hypothetical protein
MASTFHIVVNYRRNDSSGYAGRLYDDLTERFGEGAVFMDIDAIQPGVEFAKVIESAVGGADVFLSLIGPRWLDAVDAGGRRRLDLPDDFVRLEIEAALRPEVCVIPVLLMNAQMPSADDLPPSLEPLTRRNAMELRDSSWRHDVDRLIEAIERFRGEPADGQRASRRSRTRPSAPASRRRLLLLGAAAAVVLAGVVALVLALADGGSGGGGPRVSIESVDVEPMTKRSYELTKEGGVKAGATRLGNDGLAVDTDIVFSNSAAGVHYPIRYTLQTRDTSGGEPQTLGAEVDETVLDAADDQCGCHYFIDLDAMGFPTKNHDYRVLVQVLRSGTPGAQPLDEAKSDWVST